MAVIDIRNFGGVIPALSERYLPPEAATQAQNLLPQVSEFRPKLADTAYTGVLSVANPKTIYRHRYTAAGALNSNFSSGWLAYANLTHLARWPLNDNVTERTTKADGTAAPRVIDNTGADRLLGVPVPTKPTLVVNAGNYFTEQERDDAISTLKATVLNALKAALARAKVGAVYTADATQGYMEDGAETSALPTTIRYRVYQYSGYEGTIVDAYTAAVEADVAWVRATKLGKWIQADGSPAWMGAVGTWHYALPYDAYGVGLKFDATAATTALTGVTYLDASQRSELVTAATALFDPAGKDAAQVVAPLRAAVANLEAVLDARAAGGTSGATIASQVTTAISAAANQIFDALGRNGAWSVNGTDSWNGARDGLNPSWWEPQVGSNFLRADCVAKIVTDINTYVSTDPSGRSTLDVNGLMVLAGTRLGQIPPPPSGNFYLTPDLLRSTNLYPYIDGLRIALDGIAGDGNATGAADLQPLLDDLKAKSEAVTAFYQRLYDVTLPELLTAWHTSGELEKNVPEPDDVTTETRFYRITWVTDWEEEGAPSEVTDLVNVGNKDTVTLTRPAVPGGRNIAYWRVYRSNSGSETAAFQFVPNSANELGVPQATSTFLDDLLNSELQEVCPSTIWAEPPSNLKGVVEMANGIHLGFFGRTLCPSESFVPYAYPEEYRITVQYDIVGLCPWDQSTFVGTVGNPYFVTGADAASLTATIVDGNQACASARSICPTRRGVLYVSPDGLCLARPDGVQVLTRPHFTREEWQELRPTGMIVREHDDIAYIIPGEIVTETSRTLLLWLDASDTSTITEVGGKVSAWNDKSGNGRHATQGVAGDRGIRKVNRFAPGAIEFLAAEGMTFSAIALTGGTTVFMVAYWTAPSPVSHTSIVLSSGNIATPGTDYVGAISDVSGDNAGSIAVADAGVTYAQSAWDSIPTGVHIFEFAVVANNSDTKLVLDGTTLANTFLAGSSYSLSVSQMGLQPSYSSNANQLAEVLVYDGVLSAAERDDIRAQLRTKWGTP